MTDDIIKTCVVKPYTKMLSDEYPQANLTHKDKETILRLEERLIELYKQDRQVKQDQHIADHIKYEIMRLFDND